MLDTGQVDPTAVLEQAASDFVDWRPRIFGVAYRILGCASEAEDIVQEAWLRWQTTDRTVVKDPPAFLATTATRLAINVAQSARSRREAYRTSTTAMRRCHKSIRCPVLMNATEICPSPVNHHEEDRS